MAAAADGKDTESRTPEEQRLLVRRVLVHRLKLRLNMRQGRLER
jgi:hypothetical protein